MVPSPPRSRLSTWTAGVSLLILMGTMSAGPARAQQQGAGTLAGDIPPPDLPALEVVIDPPRPPEAAIVLPELPPELGPALIVTAPARAGPA